MIKNVKIRMIKNVEIKMIKNVKIRMIKNVEINVIKELTLWMCAMTSVCVDCARLAPLISKISSATSRSALSAGEPEKNKTGLKLVLSKPQKYIFSNYVAVSFELFDEDSLLLHFD